eukprot:1139524-Pelagomonas_calceolata.AAC.17
MNQEHGDGFGRMNGTQIVLLFLKFSALVLQASVHECKHMNDVQVVPVFLTFSARTSANQTQDMIDAKMEKKRKGSCRAKVKDAENIAVSMFRIPCLLEPLLRLPFLGVFGPPSGKKFVMFVDDLNMPQGHVHNIFRHVLLQPLTHSVIARGVFTLPLVRFLQQKQHSPQPFIKLSCSHP